MSNTAPATAKQVGMIKGLLTQLGLIDDSKGYAMQYSEQRTEHIGQLTMAEANLMIKNLLPAAKAVPNEQMAKAEACNTMRREIISMAREMGWHQRNDAGQLAADMDRINHWCQHHGYLSKGLNAYSYEELPKLVTQMEYALQSFRSKL